MSFRRVWARFSGTARTLTATPGAREAWHAGRRWYHVWLLTVDDPRVTARVDAVRHALGDAVVPFCADAPHVTVWVHGFEAPRAPHPAEGTRVPMVVGGANSFTSSPFLEVRAEALAALRAGFRGPEERWAAYRPHLTVGLYARSGPAPEVVARLRGLRRLAPIHAEGRFLAARIDAWDAAGAISVG
jgi:hypothetical protein